MNSNIWKKNEKDTAKAFNTQRTPFSGSNSAITASDTLHPNLYIESKVKEKHSIMTLYRETLQKAQLESKIPLLSIKETNSDEVLLCFEKQYLFEIIKEIDLSAINKKLPTGTTIDKLLKCQNTSQMSLYEIQQEIEQEIEIIFREKVLSKDNKELLKYYSILLYYIDTIKEYTQGEEIEEGNIDKQDKESSEDSKVVPNEVLENLNE